MSMAGWAEREVQIACRRENPNRKEGEFDYGCACYESALKAFKSLCEDGHSGFSIHMTKNILNRLIDGKPLTPIEDTEDIWNYCGHALNGVQTYQCDRMDSLFKYVYSDGTVKYSDNDSCYCVSVNKPNMTWHNGFVHNLVESMFPITMPYMPGAPIIVYIEEFLTDKKNGDYDTMGILYAVKPDGERIQIDRYFKDGEENFDEIDADEYNERKMLSFERGLR